MRRIVSSPYKPGGLGFAEVEVPKPGPNECLVRVSAFSMNRGEIVFAQRNQAETPVGWDAAGVVEKSAEDGSGLEQGTRAVAFCARMDGWAELVAVPADCMAPIPDSVSDAVACTLPVAGLTALYCLEKGTRLLGNRVLLTGATGGVGLFALQLGRLMGAETVAQVRKPEQADFVREYGADEVIVSDSGEEAGRLAPYRLILDGVGGEVLEHIIKFADADGVVVSYGISGGGESRIRPFPDLFGMDGQRTIQGFTLYAEVEHASAASGLLRLLRLTEKGLLKAHIAKEGSWREAGAAADELLERKFAGKAVLFVN